MVKSENFHSMRGDIEHGKQIIAPSGKVFTLKNTMRGWMVYGEDSLAVSGYLPSYHDVNTFIVYGLQNS